MNASTPPFSWVPGAAQRHDDSLTSRTRAVRVRASPAPSRTNPHGGGPEAYARVSLGRDGPQGRSGGDWVRLGRGIGFVLARGIGCVWRARVGFGRRGDAGFARRQALAGSGLVTARGRTEANQRRMPGFARRRGPGPPDGESRVRSARRLGFGRRGPRVRSAHRGGEPARAGEPAGPTAGERGRTKGGRSGSLGAGARVRSADRRADRHPLPGPQTDPRPDDPMRRPLVVEPGLGQVEVPGDDEGDGRLGRTHGPPSIGGRGSP